MLHELKQLDTSPKALGRFALQTSAVGLVLAIVLAFGLGWSVVPIILAVLVLLIAVSRLISLRALRAVYLGWMTGAFVIGTIVSWVILIVLFYAVLTPISLTARLVGKRFLDRSWHDGRESFWHWREKRSFYRKSYERQY